MRASLARDQDVLIDFKDLQQVCMHALKKPLYSMCIHMSKCLGTPHYIDHLPAGSHDPCRLFNCYRGGSP